jgi:hypothetical protein
MLPDKGAKAISIGNFMPTPGLKSRYGSAISRLFQTFQPQVQGVAADVQHPADLAFAFTTTNGLDRFAAKVVTVGRWHGVTPDTSSISRIAS